MSYTILKDHPDYSINRNGQIRAVKDKTIVKQTTDESGYKKVSLDDDTFYVHRLVAIQFLKKPIGKDEIDHINHNRSDNRISNLRWSNRSENNKNKVQALNPMNNIQITRYNTYRTRNGVGLRRTFKTIQDAMVFRDNQ